MSSTLDRVKEAIGEPSFAMTDAELDHAIRELEIQCTPVETPDELTWKDGRGHSHFVHKDCLRKSKTSLECCGCKPCAKIAQINQEK